MNRLALGKAEFRAANANRLPPAADKMHLHAFFNRDIIRSVREFREIEIAAKFAIDSFEQVEIERRADSLAIVVCGPDDCFVLVEIEPDQESSSDRHEPGDRDQQSQRLPSG